MTDPSETTHGLQLTQPGGPYAVVQVAKSNPAPHQIRIRMKAIAMNLLDKKQRDTGLFIKQYPIVLGIEGAGIVEAVGSDVEDFQPGDEVMACPAGKAKGMLDWGGAFAEHTLLPAEAVVAKKPRNVSMEEAASLPIAFTTAVVVIANSFGVPLPFLPELKNNGVTPSSVLVLGGSSTSGAAAIQILRLAHPSMTIFATCSRHNFSQLEPLGVTKLFDYHSPSIVEDIKAHTPNGQGVDMIYDFVAGGVAQPDICDVLNPAGLKQYAAVITGVKIPVPEGVKFSHNSGSDIYETDMQGRKSVLPALSKLVEEGKFKVPLSVKVYGHGLECIPQAVEDMPKVSGAKIVVTV